jgi:hypothetical protein
MSWVGHVKCGEMINAHILIETAEIDHSRNIAAYESNNPLKHEINNI